MRLTEFITKAANSAQQAAIAKKKQQGVAEGKQPGKSVVDAIQKVMPVAQEIWFHGSRATGRHRRNSDTDILVVVPDDLVGNQYVAVVRILQKLSSIFDNYDIQPTKSGTNIHRIAQEEGQLLWSNKQGVAGGLTETRNSLFAFVKQQFPTWPDYVLKDFLYAQAKGIRDQAELDDFLKRNKQDFGNCKWTLTKLPITFDIFTPKTQRMLASREGGSSNPFQVPRDAERHAQQSQMIQQKGASAEPIIVAKLSNGYDLIEGWHRTIQHLKTFPEGYTGPAWVCTGATYKSESVNQGVAEGENWSKHNNKRVGGMSKKSVSSYRRSHPGSKIQTAVTTKPSKLKKGSKAAARRKSFCARMRGMKKHRTGAKTAHDPNSNINKSLRRWHCESVEQLEQLVMLAEQKIRNLKK